MSSTPLFDRTTLQEAFAALRRDLIHEDGPRISTMRNYGSRSCSTRPQRSSSCAPRSSG